MKKIVLLLLTHLACIIILYGQDTTVNIKLQKAITSLNGTQMSGRTITVNEARPQEKRTGGGGGGYGGGGYGGGAGGGGGRGNRGGRW